ncbi:hypothetical protein TWF730_000669 [Orbilia blumenaviensis]|uniref:Autophagy-related protein 16 domain-containing protein n=1 Tax=Orbilia blumenaviensis TaxID=1796055 RepID=A0AAV9VPD8_9PEZI
MASATWRSDILVAFAERDAREKSQASIISEYTRLADRTATLTSIPTIFTTSTTTITTTTNEESPSNPLSSSSSSTPAPQPPSSDLQSLHTALTTLRTDLTTSQKDRTTLQTQLTTTTTSLSLLQKSSTANLRELDKVKTERYHLEQKLKTRDEESKLNRKIIENLQDEILALNIQLDIGEQAKVRLKSENEELISRWMALKKDEAEAMNNNSKYS